MNSWWGFKSLNWKQKERDRGRFWTAGMEGGLRVRLSCKGKQRERSGLAALTGTQMASRSTWADRSTGRSRFKYVVSRVATSSSWSSGIVWSSLPLVFDRHTGWPDGWWIWGHHHCSAGCLPLYGAQVRELHLFLGLVCLKSLGAWFSHVMLIYTNALQFSRINL